MNDMSEFRRANFSAAPSAPTGATKILPWVRAAVSGGFKIGLLMYVAQIALPHDYKPSVVFGQIAGDTERGDIEAKQNTVIAYERSKADAITQAQIKGQADLVVMQKTLETATASVEPVAQMAGTADVLCIGGKAVAAMSAPTGQVRGDWRRGITADDGFSDIINKLAKAVSGVSCGLGAPLRESARAVQLDAVRDVVAARGLSMTNGGVQVAAAPMQPALSAADRTALWDYASRLPPEVYGSIVQGLPNELASAPMIYARLAAYRAAHPGT